MLLSRKKRKDAEEIARDIDINGTKKMKAYLDCIPCFSRQGLRAVRIVTENEE